MSQRKTRVLLISDTHAVHPSNDAALSPWWTPLPPADVAIHCGDLTMTGKLEEHRRTVDLLKSLPAKLKIVIPGNHDLTLDRNFCADHAFLYGWSRPHTQQDLDLALDMYTNHEAQAAGIKYLVEGLHSFTLDNGTRFTIYASAYTPEFCDWAFPYPRSVDRFNSDTATCRIPDRLQDEDNTAAHSNIDIMVTHGPPWGILDTTLEGQPVGCEHLRRAILRSRPLLHCFGHIHEARGTARIDWTGDEHKTLRVRFGYDASQATAQPSEQPFSYLDMTDVAPGRATQFVNASIMNVEYEAVQKPWLVDIMLPLDSLSKE